jgi:hypothetical protein
MDRGQDHRSELSKRSRAILKGAGIEVCRLHLSRAVATPDLNSMSEISLPSGAVKFEELKEFLKEQTMLIRLTPNGS